MDKSVVTPQKCLVALQAKVSAMFEIFHSNVHKFDLPDSGPLQKHLVALLY